MRSDNRFEIAESSPLTFAANPRSPTSSGIPARTNAAISSLSATKFSNRIGREPEAADITGRHHSSRFALAKLPSETDLKEFGRREFEIDDAILPPESAGTNVPYHFEPSRECQLESRR